MKSLLSVALLIALSCARVTAQDATPPQSQESNNPTVAEQTDRPFPQVSNAGSLPVSGSSATSGVNKPYGSAGYGSRADIFVTGFGFFSNHANGNAIAEQQTATGGFAAGYRFHLSPSSALEGRYGFSRNSDKYTIGGVASSIPSYFSEISGSYVYSLPQLQRVRPFLEGGGGLALFIPGNYGTPASAVGGTTTGTNGAAFGYAQPALTAHDVVAPVYSGSSPGVGTQVRPMFLYGGGMDIPAFSHFYIRTEFRALGYEAPDFKLSALQTKALGFTYEPSFGVVYRF